jgi:carbon-monoxide dehydrogenase small subunit
VTDPINDPADDRTYDLLGDDEVTIEATLNGRPLRRRVKARQHLADFLRQEMELTGTHLGCEHGICGACTVLIDGRTARGCLTLAAQISGKTVDTIQAGRAAGGVHRP